MFSKIMVANRGEIAVRIIRACKELEIPTVAIYSEADRDSLHVRLADEAICIGPPPSHLSYLNIPSIISAAEVTGCSAVHPGYGFLAENPQFAEICDSCELVFIGPPAPVIQSLGNKAAARRLMSDAGIPVTPGSDGPVVGDEQAIAAAKDISYPVIIKASGGGGGRGMRVAQNEKELVEQLKAARAEAHAAFGDDELYIEKYVEEPRHIEFQILADRHGHVIHLGERDCSIQRRHQKLVEEAPSPFVTEKSRAEMGHVAVEAARAAGYVNAGTVEFLVDRDGKFHFMEMNTRIQVEHPVTEVVTGVDIVKEQIRIAAGEKLMWNQNDVQLTGHAIEFRINSEDPEADFRPSAGRISLYSPPGGPGVRIDTHLYTGYTMPTFYDSLLAKLVVYGRDREEAISRGRRALAEMIIEGVKTTIPFHQKVAEDAFFMRGEVYTSFVNRRMVTDGATRGD